MLKEFIEHIQKTTQPLITNVNGSAFCVTSDGNIEELLPTIFHPYTLDLNSLDALVTMVRTEASEMDAPLYIAVPDCKTVRCFGQSGDYDERCFRQVYYEAHATDVPGWDQKVTLGFEEAQIALRTRFQETPDSHSWQQIPSISGDGSPSIALQSRRAFSAVGSFRQAVLTVSVSRIRSLKKT